MDSLSRSPWRHVAGTALLATACTGGGTLALLNRAQADCTIGTAVRATSCGLGATESSGMPSASPAWQEALNQTGQRRLAYAYDLASRGAVHSAQQELLEVLGMVAQALDTDQGNLIHSQALTAAQVALEEAQDFLKASPLGSRPQNLVTLVASHRTRLIDPENCAQITPLTALQNYFSYAGHQFVIAAGGQQIAAEALYGLGKVLSLMNRQANHADASHARLLEQRMLVYYQAAWTVDPRHFRAANEFGVLLSRFNQWEQACRAFEYSVAQQQDLQNVKNLALAYEQLGEYDLAKEAQAMAQSLVRQGGSSQGGTSQGSASSVAPAVEWVDLETFSQVGRTASWDSLSSSERPGQGRQGVRTTSGTASDAPPAGTVPDSSTRRTGGSSPLQRWKSVFRKD